MVYFKKKEFKKKCLISVNLIVFIFIIFTLKIIPSTKYALLIGISDYKNSGLISLDGPKNDIRLIKKVLLEKFHFNKKHITILKNKTATHTKIEEAFNRLASIIGEGDFVYIHYCGHGSQTYDKDGDEYPGKVDQTWVPYGSRSTSTTGKDQFDIIDDELYLWLEPIFKKTENLILVSDSCYSGTMTRGSLRKLRTVPPDKRESPFLANSSEKNNFDKGISIGAVQDSGIACEGLFQGEIYGLFSWYWANALLQSDKGDTWGEVFNRTRIKVIRHVEWQHPKFQGNPNKPIFIDTGDMWTRKFSFFSSLSFLPGIPLNTLWVENHLLLDNR